MACHSHGHGRCCSECCHCDDAHHSNPISIGGLSVLTALVLMILSALIDVSERRDQCQANVETRMLTERQHNSFRSM